MRGVHCVLVQLYIVSTVQHESGDARTGPLETTRNQGRLLPWARACRNPGDYNLLYIVVPGAEARP